MAFLVGRVRMSSTTQAAALVLGAGGITALAQISKGTLPASRVFIGTAVAGTVILGLAEVNPELGVKFAALVFLTSLLTNGYDLAQSVTRKVST